MFRRNAYVPRGITPTGLFAIERRFWDSAVVSVSRDGSLLETLVLISSDDSEITHQAGPGARLIDSQDILRDEIVEFEIDAVLHLGFNAASSRLSLYNYWHSVAGRRVRIGDAVNRWGITTVTERDMRKATGLHSWVEDLFSKV